MNTPRFPIGNRKTVLEAWKREEFAHMYDGMHGEGAALDEELPELILDHLTIEGKKKLLHQWIDRQSPPNETNIAAHLAVRQLTTIHQVAFCIERIRDNMNGLPAGHVHEREIDYSR